MSRIVEVELPLTLPASEWVASSHPNLEEARVDTLEAHIVHREGPVPFNKDLVEAGHEPVAIY
jgi:hypothetical protein